MSPNDVRTIPLCLKAIPKLEGGLRLVYLEPSNESTDLEGERVLREALKESREYFLAKGNFDIDHLSLTGYAKGVANPRLYEIGRPLDVQFDLDRIFVKGRIYSGTGEVAQQANHFWESVTELDPPMQWWPSVGGHVREAGNIAVNGSNQKVKAIKKVYWSNVGFAREPVNPTVPNISVIPIGAFAKSWVGIGSHLHYTQIDKAVTAGYGTDVANLTGGGALREASLDDTLYDLSLSSRLIKDMEGGRIRLAGERLVPMDLIEHLVEHMGIEPDQAFDVLKKFLYARLLTRKGVPA